MIDKGTVHSGAAAVPIASWRVDIEHRQDGTILVEPQTSLGPYPATLTDCLEHWAWRAPDRTFLAERDDQGRWRRIGYAAFRGQARAAARWLSGCAGLSGERPIAILSSNGIEHALLAMGAMYAGIPYSPISPAYSLISSDFGRLRHVFELLTPGLVFAGDGLMFARAIRAVVPSGVALVVTKNPPPGRGARDFAEVIATAGRDDELDLPKVTGDSVAKILFTSGSTSVPKGVITTHGMLTSNQEMLRSVFPFLGDEPPIICDWLPWHHTFGGSHNFGLVLYNGGTMYLDTGRPLGSEFEATVANLREIAPTAYYNVPKGYEMLVGRLRCDDTLRAKFFSRLRMMFYAAAGLSQQVWDELNSLSVAACGKRVPMLTGLGATETAPLALCARADNTRAGVIGVPVPGVKLKLAPVGSKLEARVQGPNVTPGYWREPELTRAAFDEEGYYRFGDGVQFIDPSDVNQGFVFDGRLSEDFKLSTGTWVSVGPLRTQFLLHFAPYVRDVVIAGHDRDDVTALIFPDPEHYVRLRASGEVRATFERLLGTFAVQNLGSSRRIERAVLLEDPPSLDEGELTDKGTVNQQMVLRRRATHLDRLYTQPYGDEVLCAAPRNPESLLPTE
jgi:feruloyl-CoA synthase